jgi:hypothetical protein
MVRVTERIGSDCMEWELGFLFGMASSSLAAVYTIDTGNGLSQRMFN